MLCLRQRDLRDPLRCVQLRPIYMNGGGGGGRGRAHGRDDDGDDDEAEAATSAQDDETGGDDEQLPGGDRAGRPHQLLADVARGGGATLMSRCGAERLVGVTVLVATANDGYVYQFSTNGE